MMGAPSAGAANAPSRRPARCSLMAPGPLFGPRLIRTLRPQRAMETVAEENRAVPERFRAPDATGSGKLSAEELKAFTGKPPDWKRCSNWNPRGPVARIQ